MKFIFTVTFVVILGNTYASSTTSTTTVTSETTSVSSSTSATETTSVSLSTSTTDRTTTETNKTTEITTETSPNESTTDAMSSSEGPSMSLSSTTTIDVETTSTQTDITTKSPNSQSTEEILKSTSTSETSSESSTSTLHSSSPSFQTTHTTGSSSSTVTQSSVTSSSTGTSPQSSSEISVTSVSVSVTSVSSTTVPVSTTANVSTEQTKVTTEKTTPEETTTDETTEGPTSTPEETSAPITSLTTSHPTTTPAYNISREIILNTENSVIPLSIKVTFIDCMKEKDALAHLTGEILKLDTCKSVVVGESEDSCGNDTSTIIVFRVHVVARNLLSDDKMSTIEGILAAINNTGSVHTAQALAYSNIDACDSIICQQTLLQNKGFNCKSNGNNCTLTSPCGNNTCNNHGSCYMYMQTGGTRYLGICKCTDDDMYTYSGSECESKTYSWKLWTVIASGVGGGIIVVLLFAVVIQCARKKARSFNQKYGYDSGFDDRENLMYDRRYASPDEYHRKPLPRDEDTADQVNLQSFENRGYDHWEPSDSKDTYASMDRHFQDPAFHAQITRPKLTTSKYGTDKLTPF